jgi:hypothetical protein
VYSQSELLLHRMPTCFRATRLHSVGANTIITPSSAPQFRPSRRMTPHSTRSSGLFARGIFSWTCRFESHSNQKVVKTKNNVADLGLFGTLNVVALLAAWRTRWRRNCGANSSKSEVPESNLKRSCAHSAAGQGAKSKVPILYVIILD